jgi:chain length determinant protein tyrosine kinase EpsG
MHPYSSVPNVTTLTPTTTPADQIGDLLIKVGKITPEQVDRVLHLQNESEMRFGEMAVALGYVSESDVHAALSQQFGQGFGSHGDEIRKEAYGPELIVLHDPFGEHAETLRTVRTQLTGLWLTRERKALSVVSVNPGNGGTVVCANLAVLFAQMGHQTILIDANLRQPQQHFIFNSRARQGLSDLLARRTGLEAISDVEGIENLSLLPAGTVPPNPHELLGSGAFAALSQILASRFDVLLYDSPAFTEGADALSIAVNTESAILLVVQANHARISEISTIEEQVRRSGAEIVGSMLVDF